MPYGSSSTCTATASGGYTFGSFSGCTTTSGTTCTLSNVTSTGSVTGSFTQNTYAITATASPSAGGTISCTPNPVPYGSSSTCTATASGGYTFGSFSGCTTASGTTCTLSNVTSTGSVSASFVAGTVNGSCGSASGVASAIVPNANLCATGTPSLVAASAGGYSWSCAGTNSGSTAQCTAPGAAAPGGGGTVTFELLAGGCNLNSLTLQVPPSGGPGNGVVMPFGVVNFSLVDCTADTARVRATYSGSVQGMQFWKYINSGWIQVPGATIAGNSVTFDIVDNGPYDADPALHAIADPGGPGYVPVAPTATSIPTLSEWGLMLLAGLMGLFGLGRLRRGKTQA